MVDIEGIKAANKIEDVVEETHPLQKNSGRYLRCLEHDSLVIDTQSQYFVWNSQGKSGDVIEWLEITRGWEFKEAVEWLADRAGMTLHMDAREAAAVKAHRAKVDVLTKLVEFLRGKLTAAPAAAEYCERRGWAAETVERAQLGYWDGDGKGLAAFCREQGIDVNSDGVQVVMGMPREMLIYSHWVGGRCVYISGRGIHEKKHYNPTVKLMGERQVFWNHMVNRMVEHVVIVEGQADAITLGQWNIPAVALAGVAANQKLLKQLERFERVYLGLDADDAGAKNVMELAAELGPKTRIVSWPEKDPNDWLLAGGTAKTASDLLGHAPIFVIWMCERAAAAAAMERDAAMDAAIEQVAKLPDYGYEKAKKEIARVLGIGLGELNGMRKALLKTDNVSVHKVELTTPNGYIDGHLFEMVYSDDEEKGPQTSFAVRDPEGRISVRRMVETDNYRILPLSPLETILKRRTVLLASDVADYVDDLALLGEIRDFIHRHVDVPEHIEALASYYAMMTWLFDKFYVLPYLRARGDSDSGKSRFTETVSALCNRAMIIKGGTTPSPVFRLMETFNGCTVMMDEADLPYSETNADWILMLNTGYKASGSILRTKIDNGEATVEAFSAFGPKIINMRGKFPDDATESRCLTWETSSGRNYRDDIQRYMDIDEFNRDAQRIRNKLLKWRLKNWDDVAINYDHEGTKHLPGRLVEITVSLMSVSKDEDFKRSVMEFIEKMNEKATYERQATLEAKVLKAIFRAKYLPDEKAQEGDERDLLAVGHVSRQTNRIINKENEEGSIMSDDEVKNTKEIGPHRIGRIIRDKLNLETAPSGTRKNYFCVVEDVKRLDSLMRRYGLEQTVMGYVEYAEKLKAMGDDGNADGQGKLML